MQGLEEPRYRAAAMGLLALVAAVWGSQLCVDAVCDCVKRRRRGVRRRRVSFRSLSAYTAFDLCV